MDVIRKDASITNTDDGFPGSFEVVLSAPTKDRDGDTLLPDEWKQPLPDHITFDSDHGMSVATTVGSGTPRIDEESGNLIVSGTYSSLPRAQEVRTLVNEGHIRTTSVAFMTEKTQKDGATATIRELLNGAFVAIPSNREALVLSSKSLKAATAGEDEAPNFAALAQGADASLDEALNLLSAVDAESLPAEVQQALALLQAADLALDELLDALGVTDPDEDGSPDPAPAPVAAPAKAAAPAETKAADDDELQTRVRAVALTASTYTDH